MYLSIVIPVFNESAIVLALMAEIESCLCNEKFTYEVVWVDDASTDGTSEQLLQLASQCPRAIYVKHHRRGGQSNALRSGMENAHGEIFVTMDGDGQNDPRDILTLLDHLEHCNLVIGQRNSRKDRLAKRVFSMIANAVRCWATSSTVGDSGCSMRAFRKDDAKICRIDFQGWHRFLVTLVELNRGKVCVVPVTHRPRRAGNSKYGVLRRGVICMFDGIAISWLRFRRMAISDCEVSVVRGAIAPPDCGITAHSVNEVAISTSKTA